MYLDHVFAFFCLKEGSLEQVVTVERKEFEKLKLRLPGKQGSHLVLSNSYTSEVESLPFHFFESKILSWDALD